MNILLLLYEFLLQSIVAVHVVREVINHKITGPKLRFPTCSVFQNVIFSHISYT